MKVKRLKVEIRSLDEGLKEFGATLKALRAGKRVSKKTGVYFVSVEAMRHVLTEPRLKLLHLIRTRHPKSLASLAKMARRDFKNVHTDVNMLADLGLIRLGPRTGPHQSLTPRVPYERIQFEIAV